LKSSLVETKKFKALKIRTKILNYCLKKKTPGIGVLFIIYDRLDIANALFHSRQSVCKPILIASGLLKKWGPLSFSVAMLLSLGCLLRSGLQYPQKHSLSTFFLL
jgi:hypothetical protein